MYELEGTIKVIMDEQTFASGFNKREFVVTTEERYPQEIKLQFVKDKVSLLEGLAEGNRVKVTFDLRGNHYKEKDRYFVDLNAWKIENLDAAAGGGESSSGGAQKAPVDDAFAPADDENLPF